MLARLAENLFWAGRYIERANDTARLLDVTYHGSLEAVEAERMRMWNDLTYVLAQDSADKSIFEQVGKGGIPDVLVVDRANPSSILASAERVRENIRSLREHVSTELWEAVNLFWLDLAGRDLGSDLEHEAYSVLAAVKRHCQTIVGAADETMSRDEGWRFFVLGRQLERAAMTCRLLGASLTTIAASRSEIAFHDWVVLLKSAGGLEAFRNAHGVAASPVDAVSFLLVHETFPRSVRFSIARSVGYVNEIGHDDLSLPARVLGRLAADLEFCDVGLLVEHEGIGSFLDHVLSSVQLAVDAVTAEYFRSAVSADLHLQMP